MTEPMHDGGGPRGESLEAPPARGEKMALEKGTSLWADAWKRLLKNKAALTGAVIVALMGITAVSFELISAHVTRFRFDEQHLSAQPKPPGARSVPETHFRLDAGMKQHFGLIDADGDGRVEREELAAAMRMGEFNTLDTDESGYLSAAELDDAPINLIRDDAGETLRIFDEDGDGKLSPEEAQGAEITEIMPRSEARFFIRKFDRDEDDALSAAEFPGMPLPETHYFGTDELGRDMLTRVVMGARVSLLVGFIATIVSFIIGVVWGATAGFLGGKVDNAMMRFVDVMYGLPFMFLVILLMVIFQDMPADQKLYLLFMALGAVQWLTMSRIVRGQVISLKGREFVEAARAIGVSKRKIIFRHLIPNALGPIIVYVTLTVPAVMLEEAFLSFLGLGVQAPYASWGSLAAEGAKAFREYPWLIVFPGSALAITLLSLNFFGDGLRDALDPQVRKD
ncbi:MAG: ABC transporter permease subunit [Myxococcales bacterium]|nr:ABC transporter permease subunit [Myxococcales bacterium]